MVNSYDFPKKKLNEYASNTYSQYGEDGIIEEILNRLEIGPGVCGEFGASDGLACSNTAKLWRNEGWEGFLIEGSADYEPQLRTNCTDTQCLFTISMVTPNNVDSLLDVGLYEHGHQEFDVLSIDIDGDDFFVFCSMHTRAKVLLIEYNKTIPPHIDLVPTVGNKMGIGSLTLKNAAEQRGYTLLGLTKGSAIFVDSQYVDLFNDIEKSLDVLQPREDFMYLATDFTGAIIPLGHTPPWGVSWPQSATTFQPNQDDLLNIHPGNDIERLIAGIETLDARAFQINELRAAAMQMAGDMRGGYNEELRDRIERELGLK